MSNKIKRSKGLPVTKKYDGEVYRFIGGIAKVPGCIWRGKPMLIKFKEFKELSKET